jgi:cytochrome c-type biogenesis protein CcmF
MLTYVFVLYSTFLTRSGVLGDASVHSFVDPGMIVYLFLLIFIGTFIVLGFGMLFYRWKTLNEEIAAEEGFLSRDLALFTAAIVFCASAIIVLVGTSAPIFGQSVDTFFYNEMHLPLAIIIGLLNGLSLLLKWKDTKKEDIIKKSVFSIAASIVLTVLIVLFGKVTDIMMIILAFSTSFALFVNLEIAYKIVRGNMKMLGAYIAHIGIALFILGVIGSAAYSSEVSLDLVKNEPKEAFGYNMTFTGYTPIENNTKYAFNVDIKKGDKVYKVAPVMYISDFNNGLMREPAILTMITRDLYLSPLGYEEGNGHSQDGAIHLEKGSSTEFAGVKLTFEEFKMPADAMQLMSEGKDFEIGSVIVAEYKGAIKMFELKRKIVQGKTEYTSEFVQDFNIKAELLNLTAGSIDIALSTLDGTQQTTQQQNKETLTVSASIKPFVNLVWMGVAVMVFGFFVAVARRLKESLVIS